MSDIVNLRQFRKRKARGEAGRTAEANRLQFGRSRPERERAEAEAELAQRRLDAHLRQPTEGESGGKP